MGHCLHFWAGAVCEHSYFRVLAYENARYFKELTTQREPAGRIENSGISSPERREPILARLGVN